MPRGSATEQRHSPAARFHVLAISFVVAVSALSIPSSSFAQQDPISDFVFDDQTIPAIRISIDQAQLDQLFAPGNQYSDVERPATFTFIRGTDSIRVDSVGFRLRGNTSRDAAKKSFKVSFNSFRRGQKFKGLEKLNLNGEHNDPSIVRSKVAWDLFRDMGIPASRANHVRLYINAVYYGLYINVEHVDEQFLQRYFGDDTGNLYKCLWPADLAWLGSSPDAYRNPGVERRPYDLKLKDTDDGAYTDLVHLIDVLNNSTGAEFPDAIEQVLDVTGFLRVLAVTTMTGSWDSYWFLKNNYYLYANPESGRFEYIPFDFDNTMGIWWEGIYPGLEWATRDVYSWGHPDPVERRPLTTRILAVPKFRDRYTLYLKRLLSGSFDESTLQSRILSLRSIITDAAVEDTFRTLDYGFSVADFQNSYFSALGDHVTEGLVPFVSDRVRSARAQIDNVDVTPVLSEMGVSPSAGRPGTTLTFTVRAEDEQPALTVELHHQVVGLALESTTMARAWDLGPDVYAASITAPSTPTTVRYFFTAIDAAGQTGASETGRVEVRGEVGLAINELMASNLAAVRDPAGEFDDWIELHNLQSTDIDVSGFSMSDDRLRRDKWPLPDTVIEAGGYVVVWADEDGAQGPMHANFRLSSGGEFLGLFDDAGAPIDTLSFPAQVQDVAYGRVPDGSGPWFSQVAPTPGAPNAGAVGVEGGATDERASSAFPNPFRSHVKIEVRGATGGRFSVFDVLGRRVVSHRVRAAERAEFVWYGRYGNGSRAAAGVYVVRYTGSRGTVRWFSVVRLP